MAVKDFSLATLFGRLERLIARDHPGVAPAGRTIVRVRASSRERAVVLLHGMSASPSQFERIAHDLYDRGYNVLVPRLPRHGHADPLSPALERLRSDELCEAVVDYVAIARELGEHVTVAGFSMGGLLTAWAAQRFEIDRAVPIAPFFGISWIPNRLMGPVADRLLRVPNRFHWWNPILRERRSNSTGYPRYATHALAHAYRLAQELFDEARESAPAARRVTLVANATEVAVNKFCDPQAVRDLAAPRSRNRRAFVLTGLPLSHDIVSPVRWRLAGRAHPHLLDAIDPPQLVTSAYSL